jgi:DNA-binding transcriptional MerR regulator
MDKSPDAFRTISEVAEALDTPAHVLRFWETRFPQIRPVKRAGGRRYYRPSDVALLTGIKRLLHDDGLTIRGVQKILREQGARRVAALGGDVETAEGHLDDPVEIVQDHATEETLPQATVLPFGREPMAPPVAAVPDVTPALDLWPDAELPPPDDNGVLVLGAQKAEIPLTPADDAAPVADAGSDHNRLDTLLSEIVGQDDTTVALTDDHLAADLADEPAGPAGGEDELDIVLALDVAGQTAVPSPTRRDDAWRSLPLAAGEEMPMAARLRALPHGALSPRSAEVTAWIARATDLTQRMALPPRQGRP